MYRVDFIGVQGDGKTEFQATVKTYGSPDYFQWHYADGFYEAFSMEDVTKILAWLNTIPYTVKKIILRPVPPE